MLRKLVLTGAALALAGAAAAQTAPPPQDDPPILLTPGAAPPTAHEHEPGAETRRQGRPGGEPLFISPSGEPFRGPGGFERWFAQADADHDGAITLAEFRADATRFFKALDTNGDGVLDGFEVQAYENNVVPEITHLAVDQGGGRHGGRGRRGGETGGQAQAAAPVQKPIAAGSEGAARYSLLNEPEPVANADEDIDGKVSLAEWMDATQRRFVHLDHDKTGRLTRESLRPTQGNKLSK